MPLPNELQDIFYVAEIEFEDRPHGIYDIFVRRETIQPLSMTLSGRNSWLLDGGSARQQTWCID